MNIKLLQTQAEVLNSIRYAKPKSINILNYVGGLGSGKTFVGALLTASYIYTFPNSKICMIAPTIPLIRDNTFAQCVKFLKELDIVVENINKDKTMFMTSNGCTIMLTHGQTYKQLLTYEFNFIDVEEASKISNQVLKQIQGRLRYVNSDAPLILLTHTNPPSSTNHYCLKSGKLFLASSYENVNLPDGYIDELSKNMTPEEKEKFINGKITPALDDALISNYDPLELKLSACDIPQDISECKIFLTCDFNYSPQCWYTGLITPDKRFLFLTEHFNLKTNTEQQSIGIFEYLTNKYPDLKELEVYGDAAGAFNQRLDNDFVTIDNIATRYGIRVNLHIMPGNPKITQRLSIFRVKIKDYKYKFNLDKMKKTNYVFENTRIDLPTGKTIKPTKQELDTEPDLIYTPHAIDAISYLMYYNEFTKEGF